MTKILVVDDVHSIARSIQMLLSADGYDVEVCHDGDTAIEKLNTQSYDLLITDLLMPGRNGIDVLKHIRAFNVKRTTSMPVVVITGGGSIADLGHLMDKAKAYTDHILEKPFTAVRLRQVIQTCLNDETAAA